MLLVVGIRAHAHGEIYENGAAHRFHFVFFFYVFHCCSVRAFFSFKLFFFLLTYFDRDDVVTCATGDASEPGRVLSRKWSSSAHLNSVVRDGSSAPIFDAVTFRLMHLEMATLRRFKRLIIPSVYIDKHAAFL